MKIFEHYPDMEVNKVGYTPYLCDRYYAVYLKKTRPYKINFRKELFNEMEFRKRNDMFLSPDIPYYWYYTKEV